MQTTQRGLETFRNHCFVVFVLVVGIVVVVATVTVLLVAVAALLHKELIRKMLQEHGQRTETQEDGAQRIPLPPKEQREERLGH